MSDPGEPTVVPVPEAVREEAAPAAAEVEAALAAESVRRPFGPVFFLTQLRAFVRDRCPEPDVRLPVVEIHLVDGCVLELCHVIGAAPGWVALAVVDDAAPAGERRMRTDLVPYSTIVRVSIRPARIEAPGLGFRHTVEPRVLDGPRSGPPTAAESALAAAAGWTSDA